MVVQSIDGKLVIFEHKKLCVVGCIGNLRNPLEQFDELYKNESIEFAPVRNEENRKFLAAFSFNPVIDITLAQYLRESSIVTYSLDKNGSKSFVEDIIKRSGFIPSEPDKDFIESIGREVSLVETTTYNLCTSISQLLSQDLDKVFGAVRYCNFLKQYRGLSEEDGFRLAKDRFGLKR